VPPLELRPLPHLKRGVSKRPSARAFGEVGASVSSLRSAQVVELASGLPCTGEDHRSADCSLSPTPSGRASPLRQLSVRLRITQGVLALPGLAPLRLKFQQTSDVMLIGIATARIPDRRSSTSSSVPNNALLSAPVQRVIPGRVKSSRTGNGPARPGPGESPAAIRVDRAWSYIASDVSRTSARSP